MKNPPDEEVTINPREILQKQVLLTQRITVIDDALSFAGTLLEELQQRARC
ncbi:hypothetical protein ACRQ1B_25105 [Rhizobium panacihumi]|uniref:hypothetical protein n=1 Tax=Rhizobium panacihumi TaxID=2008450 RepID=UPI003D7A099A